MTALSLPLLIEILLKQHSTIPPMVTISQAKQRVGRVSHADFYTSESLGKVFAELVINAAQKLLKIKSYPLIILLRLVQSPNIHYSASLKKHPFQQHSVIRQGDALR